MSSDRRKGLNVLFLSASIMGLLIANSPGQRTTDFFNNLFGKSEKTTPPPSPPSTTSNTIPSTNEPFNYVSGAVINNGLTLEMLKYEKTALIPVMGGPTPIR
jgi:hypothetical protein